MKKRVIGVIVAMVLAVPILGCSLFEADKAIGYNDKIVGIQSSVINSMLDMAGSFQSADGALMQQKLAALQKASDQALIDAGQITPMENDEGLLNSGMALFQFYKRLAHGDFATMVQILSKENMGPQDIAQIDQISARIDQEETQLDAAFASAQERFAKKYGLPLLDNELQKKIDAM